MSKYDVIIIGAGPGGIFAAYELMQKAPELKVAVFEAGNPLEKRKCPIDGKKVWEAYDRDLAERENLEQQDAYYQGIRFGARFMLDVLLEQPGSYEAR